MDEKKTHAYMDDLVAYIRDHEVVDIAPQRDAGKEDGTTAISREIGAFYERLRYAVDNKEEQFFRRYAIRRAIRRASLFRGDAEKIFDILTSDLERGGYLRPGELGSIRSGHAKLSLAGFVKLQEALRNTLPRADFHRVRTFLLDIVAGALEDALYDTTREEGIVVAMTRAGLASIDGEVFEDLKEEKKRVLFYIASWRSLFSADPALLRYKLWLFAYPLWDHAETDAVQALAQSFRKDVERINNLIDHPLGRKLLPRLHNLSIAHTLIYDALREYGSGLPALLLDRALFRTKMREYISSRYKKNMARVRRRSMQSILYIFVTKALLAVAVESVYVFVWKHTLNVLATSINLAFHPALLFMLTSGVRAPDERNTERAIALTESVAYGGQLPHMSIGKEKTGLLVDLALGCYILLLCVSMWGIVSGLQSLRFHGIDIAFFVLFLLLVLYFGYRIRFSAYRMRFADTKEGILRSFIELLLLPLVSLGRFMSMKFERINVIVFFLDFVIEAPLRILLRFFDTFSSVVERRKDEIYAP